MKIRPKKITSFFDQKLVLCQRSIYQNGVRPSPCPSAGSFFSRRLGSINDSVSNPGKMSTTSALVHGIVPGDPARRHGYGDQVSTRRNPDVPKNSGVFFAIFLTSADACDGDFDNEFRVSTDERRRRQATDSSR